MVKTKKSNLKGNRKPKGFCPNGAKAKKSTLLSVMTRAANN